MDRRGSTVTRLIQAAREHRPGALDELLPLYRNYLLMMARTGIDESLLGKADASDLAQEALLKAQRHFSQFNGRTEAELVAWVRQIMARSLADLVRSYRKANARRVSRERSLEQVLDASSLALGGLVAARSTSPSAAAHGRELTVVLADALTRLSADHREVIILRSLEERDWDEVADEMGRSVGAARILWTRALKELRPLMEERL